MIDLRSDTVTKPTPAMRRAMAEAEVGDDVYGEDPTVNRLQERAAEIFEKEAALFVPTGSMGNQTAVKLHTRPGQEVIIEERGHIFNFEMATMSAFSGVLARPVKSNDSSGILTWDESASGRHASGRRARRRWSGGSGRITKAIAGRSCERKTTGRRRRRTPRRENRS